MVTNTDDVDSLIDELRDVTQQLDRLRLTEASIVERLARARHAEHVLRSPPSSPPSDRPSVPVPDSRPRRPNPQRDGVRAFSSGDRVYITNELRGYFRPITVDDRKSTVIKITKARIRVRTDNGREHIRDPTHLRILDRPSSP